MALVVKLTGLVPETPYLAEVVATNAAGTHLGSPASFATTGPPSASSVSVGALTPKSATLGGVVVPDGHTTSWYFQYGTTTAYGTKTATGSVAPPTTGVHVVRAIVGLTANTNYHFRLVTFNAAGTVAGADSTFTTPGPTICLLGGVGDLRAGRRSLGNTPGRRGQ